MSVFVMSDGVPVELDGRLWSFDSTVTPVAPNAYIGSYLLDPEKVWNEQPWVRRVAGFLARNIAQVSLHAFERDGDDRKRIRDGELPELLDRPSPAQTQYDMLHSLVVDVCLRERYAARLRMLDDGSLALIRIPPRRWKFKRDEFEQPTAIMSCDKNGEWREFPLSDFVWIDGYPCPEGKTSSPLQSLAAILNEEQQAANYRAELWAKGPRVPGWLTRPSAAPQWSDKAKGAFQTGWQKFAAEGARAGETPLLEDDMNYHEAKSGVSPSDGQHLESRKFSLAETAASFYVPPVFVGLDQATFANLKGYREILYSDTLGPWFMRLQQAFNARLLSNPLLGDTSSQFVEFNVAEKLRLAFEEQIRILQSAIGGPFMTRNEGRQRVNLPGIGAEGDELITPLNVLIGGQASPTDSAPENVLQMIHQLAAAAMSQQTLPEE
jgi:HK97 family phage portal protein